MKVSVYNEPPVLEKPEKHVKFKLVNGSNCVCLMATSKENPLTDDVGWYYVMSFNNDGTFERCRCISSNLGLSLDQLGSITERKV